MLTLHQAGLEDLRLGDSEAEDIGDPGGCSDSDEDEAAASAVARDRGAKRSAPRLRPTVVVDYDGVDHLADIVAVMSVDRVMVQWHKAVTSACIGWAASVLDEDYSIVPASSIRRLVKVIPQLVRLRSLGRHVPARRGHGVLVTTQGDCKVTVVTDVHPVTGVKKTAAVSRVLLYSERGLLHVG